MILYIHGFRTTANSYKAELLKAHYGNKLIASDHSFIPQQAIKDLEQIIKDKNITAIIASSLGGFYATYLSQKYNLKTVLINPSVKPYETTKKYLGENVKDNGEIFIWKEEHLKMLETLKVNKPKLDNFFLFLQTGDEVLDYRVAKSFYQGSKLVIENGGNHRFKDFERFFDEVSEFLD
ncbi:Putative esterase, FIGfam005057 [hydrothermal vent metagenome]|uniref:Putative esterase, FIGfam005057 n=1 Tax=hydrothermal vent metagenome TaxID=652676 RepID=A0A1W1CRJ9_9ZZZZ